VTDTTDKETNERTDGRTDEETSIRPSVCPSLRWSFTLRALAVFENVLFNYMYAWGDNDVILSTIVNAAMLEL